MEKPLIKDSEWWREENGYFGPFYLKGDTFRDDAANAEPSLEGRTRYEVNGLEALLCIRGGLRVLDCPCGYGRHSIELGNRGYIVVGVDLNNAHLQKANFENVHPYVQFAKGNMLDLTYENEFDIVINVFASFGFFDTDELNKRVLMNFYRALKPGGKFLMHIDANISGILNLTEQCVSEKLLKNGEVLRIKDVYFPDTKRLIGSWTLVGPLESVTRGYSVRIYQWREFEELCLDVGFSDVEVYGDWSGSPYSEDSADMIVIARK